MRAAAPEQPAGRRLGSLLTWAGADRSGSLTAALERVINRGGGAVVGLVMVFYVSPREMGFYAAAFLVYTLALALGDSAVRQAAAPLWHSPDGAVTLRRSAALSAALTGSAMVLFGVLAFTVGTAGWQHAGWAAALGLAGVLSASGLPRVTYAEAMGRWSFLARQQFIASCISIVVGAALVPFVGIGGGFAQTIVCEGVFFLRLPRPGTSVGAAVREETFGVPQIAHTSMNNALGWVQGQLERVVIGLTSGPVLLGYYAIAFQFSRSLSDPAATGLMSWLRNALSPADSDQSSVFDSALRRAAAFGLALQAVTFLAFLVPLTLLLPDTWTTSLKMAVVLSASLPMVLVQWSMSAMLLLQQRSRDLFPWQILGVLLTLGCGLLFPVSIWVGVGSLVLRDLLLTAGRAWLTRSYLRGRTLGVLGAAAVAGLALAGVAWGVVAMLRPHVLFNL